MTNPPFQYLWPLLFILSVFSNVDFVDTRHVVLIGPYLMCYNNIHECVLTIELNKPLETHEQIFGNS